MLKITFVTQNLAPFRMQWLVELGKYCEITVFHNGEYEKDINSKFISDQYETLNITMIKKNILKTPKKFFDFGPVFKKESDLLILDGYGFLSQQILILILKLINKKYVVSVDGGILRKESYMKYMIKKFFISGADAYLSTSDYTDHFILHYGGNKAKIYRHLFSSVATTEIIKEYFRDKARIRRELALENKTTIIAVGRFIKRKGFDVLLRALKTVESDVQLLLVGGEVIEEYELLLRECSHKTVQFIKFCEKEKLKKYYLASDIFVLPTREDIWGLVIGEAFAMGLPVITTDRCIAGVSMIKEGENGFIVPVEDEKELALKIDILAGDEKLREEMAKKNLKVISKYAIDNAALQDMDSFQKIFNNK